MSNRKKFNISSDINQGFTDVINAVNNNVGSFRYEIMALSRIETDPANPRELTLTDKDIKVGIEPNDPDFAKKKKEKDELESLTHTVKKNGIINPIVVYKYGDKYRIIAGERRYLAALLAGKVDIHSRIIDKKPNELDLRLLQWVENNERADLSLRERLNNIQSIINAYSDTKGIDTFTGGLLKNLTGLSQAQSYNYLSVLKGPNDLKESISNGKINNLEKAALIANISNPNLREKVLAACLEGKSMKALKEIVSLLEVESKIKRSTAHAAKRGRVTQYVNLGKTKNIDVIKKIVDVVLEHQDYKHYAGEFSGVNWNEPEKVALIFQKLLSVLAAG
jgi:ParB family transcriptional regulator, chromosome partitioning protein